MAFDNVIVYIVCRQRNLLYKYYHMYWENSGKMLGKFWAWFTELVHASCPATRMSIQLTNHKYKLDPSLYFDCPRDRWRCGSGERHNAKRPPYSMCARVRTAFCTNITARQQDGGGDVHMVDKVVSDMFRSMHKRCHRGTELPRPIALRLYRRVMKKQKTMQGQSRTHDGAQLDHRQSVRLRLPIQKKIDRKQHGDHNERRLQVCIVFQLCLCW